MPFHKEEVEKTRERREKTTPLAVLVYVVFVVLLNAPAPETTRAFFFFGCAGFVRRFSFPFSSSRLFVFAEYIEHVRFLIRGPVSVFPGWFCCFGLLFPFAAVLFRRRFLDGDESVRVWDVGWFLF